MILSLPNQTSKIYDISWANPLAKGLSFAWYGPLGKDLVTKLSPNINQQIRHLNGLSGGYTQDITGNRCVKFSNVSGAQIATKFSIVYRGYIVNLKGTVHSFVSMRNTVDEIGCWNLYMESGGSQRLILQTNDGDPNAKYFNNTTFDNYKGIVTIGVSQNDSTVAGYIKKGIEGNIDTETPSLSYPCAKVNNIALNIGARYDPESTNLVMGIHEIVYVFQRTLSKSEMTTLINNPYQILRRL